jgi:hypothetical protein
MLQYLIIDSNRFMLTTNTPPKLLDKVRDRIRVKHFPPDGIFIPPSAHFTEAVQSVPYGRENG